jgi:hypothetical protein
VLSSHCYAGCEHISEQSWYAANVSTASQPPSPSLTDAVEELALEVGLTPVLVSGQLVEFEELCLRETNTRDRTVQRCSETPGSLTSCGACCRHPASPPFPLCATALHP